MTIGYKILFKINILHEYYTDWKSSDFVIRPTKETEQILKNHQMLYRQIDDGILIFASVEDSGGDIKMKVPFPFNGGLKMVFFMELKNPYFVNFTNIPMKVSPEMTAFSPFRRGFYLDNRDEKIASPASPPDGVPASIKVLSRNASQVVGADWIPFIPSIFRIHFDSPINSFVLNVKKKGGQNVTLKNRAGEDLLPFAKTTVGPENAFDEVEIDLSQLEHGWYKFQVKQGGNTDNHLMHIGNEAYHTGPAGLIEVYHETKVPASYRILDGDILINDGTDYTPPEYFVWFKNRATTWRYIFPSEPVAAPPNQFKKVGNNYESKNPKLLKEAYRTIQDEAGNKFPNPDYKNVIPDSSSMTTFYSDIYLYP